MNYDPTATLSDESCVYPSPFVEVPNIFTPNGDDINDIFELDLTNVVTLDLVILNRWGNLIFDQSGPNPTWNGTLPNGVKANEGTYFYKYVATGINGDTVDGHGYVQLVID